MTLKKHRAIISSSNNTEDTNHVKLSICKSINNRTEHTTSNQEHLRESSDRWFDEKVSGKNTAREELQRILDYARDGETVDKSKKVYTDTIYVDSFSRFARSTKDLLHIIEQIDERLIKLVSIKENLDTSTPQGKLMITMIVAINQFERKQLLERQAEGIAIAKANGKYKGRKKVEVTEQLRELYQQWKRREKTKKEIMDITGLARTTLHRRFKELEEEEV